jgi:acetyl esterase/lipase
LTYTNHSVHDGNKGGAHAAAIQGNSMIRTHAARSLLGLALATSIAGTAWAGEAGKQVAAAAHIGADVTAVGVDSFANVKVDFPDGVRGYPDVIYQTLLGYRPMKLDLFLPPASFDKAAPRPWVMYIHGGGWVGGGPRRSAAYKDWPKVLASLSAKGYVVASVSYRFAKEAPFPAAIQDVKAAIRFLKANAGPYHLDPNRGMTWGQSAGGHLAALAAVSCGVPALSPPARVDNTRTTVELVASTVAGADQQSDCVQGAVAWFGIYDFATLRGPGQQADGAGQQFLGCGTAPCDIEKVRAASPETYVSAKSPPIFLMHGSEDKTVPIAQSRHFYESLKAAGVKTDFVTVPGVGHSWIGANPPATEAASKQALVQSIDFIEATIGDKH